MATTDKRLIRSSREHTAAEPAAASNAQRASPSWLDGSPRIATQRQQLDHLFGPIVQRKVYPPKPTYITELEVEQWNAFLATWATQVAEADGLEDWVADEQVTMWNQAFNFATSMGTLRQKVRDHILTYRIDLGEAEGIGWNAMLRVIRLTQPSQLCTVTIATGVPYDGGEGTTWYVKGKVTGRDQRGGWKDNAMEDGYLPNARVQVRKALEIHNEEVVLFSQTVV